VSLFSVEMQQKSISLGSERVAVAYPPTLDVWFDDLIEARDREATSDKSILIRVAPEGSFTVLTDGNPSAVSLDLGDALATFWERACFSLLDDLSGAIAFHAAVLCQDGRFVLLPGRTGSGKTRLALWYRLHGFDLCSDEIATFSSGGSSEILLDGALRRPLVLKSSADPGPLLRRNETPLAQASSSCGLLLKLQTLAPGTRRALDHGLIVFPRFEAGATLSLTALTAGEAALGLIENCLNARNLPRGGLSFASRLGSRLPAVSLVYGETGQLDGTLDAITRQVLAAPPEARDLVALCDAFSARAAIQSRSATTSAPPAQAESSIAKRKIPAPTLARFSRRLTVGMATYDDYDGVYFTLQSMRINNPELEGALEFVIIDNNPGGACSEALSELGTWINGYRYIPRGEWSGTAIRNAVFEEASSPFVLCVDSHVVIVPGALSKLTDYFEAHPDSRDLLQGPMLYDDLRKIATHMEPRWRAGMYGTWAEDERGADPLSSGFEIPLHGLGLFACGREAWPTFNRMFRGFGGEEGYIHEKIRQRGGRTLCLPFLRWLHRFGRPMGLPYLNRWEDRMRNYMIGFTELGLDPAEMEAHFAEFLGAETSAKIFDEIKRELEVDTRSV
jgi:Glycosyl transferase family 2